MAQRRWPWVVAGTVGVGAVAWWVWSRRPRPVVAPTRPLTPEEAGQAREAASREAVTLDEPLGTLVSATVTLFDTPGAAREQVALLMFGNSLRLSGPADQRLVLRPDTTVQLALEVANGGADTARVVVDAELVQPDGRLVAAFWTGDVRRPTLTIPAHSLASLTMVSVGPAKMAQAGSDLSLVIALATNGQRVIRYSAERIFWVGVAMSESPVAPPGTRQPI